MLSCNEPHHTIALTISALPALERAVLQDHFICGDSFVRISQRYNIPQSKIGALIKRALYLSKAILRSRGVLRLSDVL
jgi:DNA-directed RNA polymerase specialized sigma24 family protein